jgi:hypothetical protein
MAIIFSSGRTTFDASDWDVTVNTSAVGSTLLAGTYYFSLQGRNRVGFNEPIYKQITISNNDSIIIDIFSTSYQDGEDWRDLIISYSTTGDPSTYYQIIALPFKYDGTEIISGSLPQNIELLNPNDLESLTTFATEGDIVDTTFYNGRIIYINSLANAYELFRFDNSALIELDGVNAFLGPAGVYRKVSSPFTIVTDAFDYKGSNLDIQSDLSLLDIVFLPVYILDGSQSPAIKFTILNVSQVDIPAQSLITLNTFINTIESTSLLSNSVFVTYRGFTNLQTGALRKVNYATLQAITELDNAIIYNVENSNLFTPDVIKPDEGFVIEVYFDLDPSNFSALFNDNSGLFIFPKIDNVYIRYSPFYEIFTDGARVNSLDTLNLLPTASGNILVESGEVVYLGYISTRNFSEDISIPTSENKQLVLDVAGNITAEDLGSPLAYRNLIVATIYKETGESVVSSPQQITISANSSISLDLEIGLDVDNKLTIRAGATDPRMRGNKINPFIAQAYLYVVAPDTNIYQIPVTLTNVTTQNVTISDLTGATILTSVNTTTPFGLIDPPVLLNPTENLALGLLPAGQYTIYVGYDYTGFDVTDIRDTLQIFDINNLGGSSNTSGFLVNKQVITTNSTTTSLDLESNTVFDITVTQDTTIASSATVQDGATVTIILRFDNVGGHTVNFASFYDFGDFAPFLDSDPDTVNIIKCEVTDTGANCYIETGTSTDPSSTTVGNGTTFGNGFAVHSGAYLGGGNVVSSNSIVVQNNGTAFPERSAINFQTALEATDDQANDRININFKIDNLMELTSVDASNDFLIIWDASTSSLQIVKPSNLPGGGGGGGDMLASVYDPGGINSNAFIMDNMIEGTVNLILTVSERNAITANTAKVSNANHTGDVAGDGVLTLQNEAITNKTAFTPESGDFILGSDTSNSGNLGRIDVSPFLDQSTPGLSEVSITSAGPLTSGAINNVDTSGGAFAVTLENTPANGTKLAISDFASSFGTNNLTINPSGGNTILNDTSVILDIDDVPIRLVFRGNNWSMW